ncbi:6,7-dimethyl-8-ribityllumazine synthase [soil metagenome]
MTEDQAASARTKAHLLIVEARYYADLCDELAKGAIAAAEQAGATWQRLAVPGALEIPGAIVHAERSGRFDGYVALGCVLRGETTHYDIVANESSRGIMTLTLQGLCIGNGILTCENEAQAWARARVNELNKGGGAAEAALALIRVSRDMKR